jgi:RimJ/RimL family protein N-acetyltransferase
MIEIRKLTLEDAAAFRPVRLQALQQFPTAFGSSWETEQHVTVEQIQARWSANDPAKFFLIGAFDYVTLVGIVGFTHTERKKVCHKGTLMSMFVSPEVQQKGIGSRLVSYLLDQAKQIPELEQIQLAVVSTNESAKRLYEKFGFETYGVEKRALQHDGQFYDEDLMALFIK